MLDPKLLDNFQALSDEEWEKLTEQWTKEAELEPSLEDSEEILDQMIRMGGGNLIGRPSQYEKLDQTASKH